MTVSKITTPPNAQEQINKINEIIDNLGGGGSSGLVYSATNSAITPTSGIASWTVSHNLNTSNIVVSLFSNGLEIEKNVTINSANSITIEFSATSTVTAGSVRVVVLGSGATSDTSNLADKNLSNITTTASALVSSLGKPTTTYETLTVGANGTEYTAPANGWFVIETSVFDKYSFYSGSLQNTTSGGKVPIGGYGYYDGGGLIPVKQGDKVVLNRQTNDIVVNLFRFVYDKGTESEAS